MNPYGDVMTGYNYGAMDSGYGFTGEQIDPNELVYLRARYYDPTVGVFASLDPFEGVPNRPMSVNGYSWVEGNVANWSDASGMSPILANIFNGLICMQQTSDGISDLCLQECNHLTGFGYAVCLGLCETCQDYWRVSPEDCSVFSFVRHPNPNPPIIHTFADSEYPLSCDQFSDAETCMLYHMIFLSGTNTIADG